MPDYSDLIPANLKPGLTTPDGLDLKPSLVTSLYTGGTPSAANQIKPHLSNDDGSLKAGLLTADGSSLKPSLLSDADGLVDPYGPELLANPELTGYVAGTPGSPPIGWLNDRTDGSLSDPRLTLAATAGRRVLYQSIAVTPGEYRIEADITLNSGTAAIWNAIYCFGPAGTTLAFFADGNPIAPSSSLVGHTQVTVDVTITNAGSLKLSAGSGVGSPATANVTITAVSAKRKI